MTKNEIIRELAKCNPLDVASLIIVYHNKTAGVKYVFSYEFSTSLDSRRELALVILSIYRLRRYVDSLKVVYSFTNDDGDFVVRYYNACKTYSHSISEFIRTIKK